MKQVEEIISKVKKSELGTFDAFVQLTQMIQTDESLLYLSKKIRFWNFEINNQQQKWNDLSKQEKIQYLTQFVFKDKKKNFKFDKLQKMSKKSEQIILGICLQSLATLNGIKMSFYQLGKDLTLKVDIEGNGCFISIDEEGRVLDTQEIMDLLFDFGCVKPLEFKDVFLSYLQLWQVQFLNQKAFDQVLKIYDVILTLRQADARTLLRRVYLLKDLGKVSEAMNDLKRFLSFQPVTPITSSLMKLYNHLQEARNQASKDL